MVLTDHEGQGHILRTVFMMDKHELRLAILSGDSSCSDSSRNSRTIHLIVKNIIQNIYNFGSSVYYI